VGKFCRPALVWGEATVEESLRVEFKQVEWNSRKWAVIVRYVCSEPATAPTRQCSLLVARVWILVSPGRPQKVRRGVLEFLWWITLFRHP